MVRKAYEDQEDSAMPRRAYSYARYSAAHQRDGDSLRRQAEWAESVCQQQGWCLDDTLAFVDRARSAFHGKNRTATAALVKFLDLVERGRIAAGSVLIVENIDRLSRQEVDKAYDLFRSIIRAGIWICTKTPFRIYKRETNSFMDLMEPIWIMYVAYMESAKKSDRSAAAWKAARVDATKNKAPIPGSHPSWLRKMANGYELIPEAVALVKRIHRLAQEGHGFPAIRRILETEGVPSLGRSRRWSDPFLRNILRGRMVLGEYHPHQDEHGDRRPAAEPIIGYYPAVLDEEEWMKTQAAIDSRYHKRGRPGVEVCNLFVGVAFDADTRLPLRIRSKIFGGKKYPYLTVQETGGCSIRYEAIETAILDRCIALLRPSDVQDPCSVTGEREEQLKALAGRLAALSHRKDQLTAAASDLSQDVEAILPALRSVTEECKETAKQLERLKFEALSGRSEALGEIQTLREMRNAAKSKEERDELNRRIRAALPSIVSSIWMKAQKVSQRHQVVHVQIFLRSGKRFYVQDFPSNLHGAEVHDYMEVDLRALACR